MKKNETSRVELRREEIRGLFVLGLLAILVAIKFQNEEIIIKIGKISFDIIPLLTITIISWSLYAFFMVLGVSEDVIGKSASEIFKEFSRAFLALDFLLLGIFSIFVFYAAYPSRLPWVLCLIFILILHMIVKKLRETKKEIKSTVKRNV